MNSPTSTGSPPTAQPVAPVLCTVEIHTETGSRYVVMLTADSQWWLAGKNVPNPDSTALPPGAWRIDAPAPWPPIPGLGLYLGAARDLPYGHPDRLPGGGKNTSPVQGWRVLSGNLPDGGRDPLPGRVFNLIVVPEATGGEAAPPTSEASKLRGRAR